MSTAVPAIPLNALSAVKDENTRIVLQALVDGWQVRNNAAGEGRNAFVTRADLTNVTGARQRDGSLGLWPTFADYAKQFVGQASPGAVVADIEASLQSSLLFQQLGSSIGILNQSLTAEQLARANAVQGVADQIAAEAQARLLQDGALGGQILSLETATGDHAEQISLLGVWKIGAASSITTLQDATATQAQTLTQLGTSVTGAETAIAELNTTTGNQAQTLTSLTTRVGDAETAITTLNTTTGNQATSLQTLSVSLGTKADTYFQPDAPTGTIATGSLWFDSDDNNKPYRWSGGAWQAVDSPTSLSGVMAAITSEQNARVSADNAITNSFNTQISTLNDNVATLSQQSSTIANSYSGLATSLSTLQTTVGNVTTSVQQETEARTTADGQMLAKYSVKIDANGYVSGYGLLSTANNAAPTSEFIVRADKFAIGSPSGPGITPRIPFSVLTTADADGNQPGVYMDNVVIKAASITGAYIADLAVDTLKIADDAVTLPDFARSTMSTVTATSAGTTTTIYARWEDTGELVTESELQVLRGKTEDPATMNYIFESNPRIYLNETKYAVLAQLPVRDYSGQPVIVFYDITIGNASKFSRLNIARVEEDGNGQIVPSRTGTWYVPRSWYTGPISYMSYVSVYYDQINRAGWLTPAHEVVTLPIFTNFANPASGVYRKNGFTRDSPTVEKRWSYALYVMPEFNDSVVDFSGLDARVATLGLKK